MGCHCNERGEYELKRKKAEVTAIKMMQYESPLLKCLRESRFQIEIQSFKLWSTRLVSRYPSGYVTLIYFTWSSIGLTTEGSKLNRTDETDRTDKNRIGPTACQFGFRFYMISVSDRFGSVRFGPNPTKTCQNTHGPTNPKRTDENRTEQTARRFGFGSSFS